MPFQQPRHIQRTLERFGALTEPGHLSARQQVIPDPRLKADIR